MTLALVFSLLLTGLSQVHSPPAVVNVLRKPIQAPEIRYDLTFVPGNAESFPLTRRPTWQLTVRGNGLSPQAGAVALVFDGWGDWQEIDALYLDVQSCDPPVDADLFPGNALVLQQPADWNGTFEVRFAIHPLRIGSRVQQRWGMLPNWAPSYSFGQTRNVFPQVVQDQASIVATRVVHLHAPLGVPIASGWGGLSQAEQVHALNPTQGNGFLAFGTPLDSSVSVVQDARLEVLQYGLGHNAVQATTKLVQGVAESIVQATGVPIIDPCVVFLVDSRGGGMGAEHGLVLGYARDTPDWQMRSPYFLSLVAHEFYHDWLGIRLEANEDIVWLHEGFTDYFALWHLAASGMISREWFAERIFELGKEAEERSAWGQIAFADEDIPWRDGDGVNETMAYKGGTMLAFAMDVALRREGHPGAPELIRDWMAEGVPSVTLERFEHWCLEHDLSDFFDRFVAGTEVIDYSNLLEQIGYDVEPGIAEPGIASESKLDEFFTFTVEN